MIFFYFQYMKHAQFQTQEKKKYKVKFKTRAAIGADWRLEDVNGQAYTFIYSLKL